MKDWTTVKKSTYNYGRNHYCSLTHFSQPDSKVQCNQVQRLFWLLVFSFFSFRWASDQLYIARMQRAQFTTSTESRSQTLQKKKILTYNYSILGGMKKDANTWKASKSSSDISWRCCFSVFITEMFLQREKRMELFAILGVSQ